MSRLMHVLSEKRSDMVCLGQGLLLWGWVMCLESQKTNVFFLCFLCIFVSRIWDAGKKRGCVFKYSTKNADVFFELEKNAYVFLKLEQKTRMCF